MIAALHAVLRQRLALLPEAARMEPAELLRRDAPGGLAPPDRRSANRHCRLIAAQDGWLALNLAREDDRELVPALTGCAPGDDPWEAVAAAAREEPAQDFAARAIELQLPVALPGEAAPLPLATHAPPPCPGPFSNSRLRVLDLSALWAGPLCAGLLARAGAEVTRVESLTRPDPTAQSSPLLDARLNGGKRRIALDLRDRRALPPLLATADVLVTSGRAPALARLGLDPAALLADHPGLVWIAITAHGWASPRVGFGDDCAVAGGLIGAGPAFMGDALADPLTGLEAALAALDRLARREGGLVDMPLAGVAASYAASLAPRG